MAVIINFLIIGVIILIVASIVYFRITDKQAPVKKTNKRDEELYTIPLLTEYIKKKLDEITKTNLYDLGLSEEEFERRKRVKFELKKALKGAGVADRNDKKFVKDLMGDLLTNNYNVNEKNINKIISFDNPELLTSQDKFDILIFNYQKEHGYNALSELISKYKLDEQKYIYDPNVPSYVITDDEINNIYQKEIQNYIPFEDKLKIVVQRIYQNYKGFSVIDEIRDMNIDGVSGGVSGLPESFFNQIPDIEEYIRKMNYKRMPHAYDSIWIFYKGKAVYLSFLSFGSTAELKRVCQNIYKYNNPGQLTETNGYKINEMKDGSRVVVLRPNFSESWAFFVRKFAAPTLVKAEKLLIHKNKEDVVELLKYIIRGARVTSITGEQGTGKTTLLASMIAYLYPTITIRVQETAFELHLRKLYPFMNILSLRETDTITGQQGLDVQKKTDGGVNILGEVATDPVAAWMIQMAQVASKFTIFTHHAKTFPNLITSLRNSLLKIGMFNNEKVAEQQVVHVINFDIHLKKDVYGTRYIERITECLPVEEEYNYSTAYRKAATVEDKLDKFMDNAVEFFKHMTDKKIYEYKNIVEYKDGEYIFPNKISKLNTSEMLDNMAEQDRKDFEAFIHKVWRGKHE